MQRQPAMLAPKTYHRRDFYSEHPGDDWDIVAPSRLEEPEVEEIGKQLAELPETVV